MQRNASASFQPQRRFVSERELEQVTGIPRRTWQKHRLSKRGPRYYKIYGTIRYDIEEVIEWIKAMAVSSSDGPPTRPSDAP